MKLFFQNKSDGRQESGPSIPLSHGAALLRAGRRRADSAVLPDVGTAGAGRPKHCGGLPEQHFSWKCRDDRRYCRLRPSGRRYLRSGGADLRLSRRNRPLRLSAGGGHGGGRHLFDRPVEISEESRITGNIRCERAAISGTVTGDVEAAQSVVLTETAVLNGNLCAGEIEIRKGAALHGLVKIERSELRREQSAGQTEDVSQPEPIVL